MGSFKMLWSPLPEETLFQTMFLKKHNGGGMPEDRTLFILNAPSSDKVITSCLEKVGNIEKIIRTNVKNFAHVIFENEEDLQSALQLDSYNISSSTREIANQEAKAQSSGLSKWTKSFVESRPEHEDLLLEVDEFMNNYDLEKKAEEEEEDKDFGIPDEDGFVSVSRKGGQKTLRMGRHHISVFKTPLPMEEIIKKQKKLEYVDFYKFQQREQKREQLSQLREKFEEDKKKISEMRASRRFKPY
eukprot:TRINITY_DN3957_c0_g1_i1.p1 TRINITY_DN3957_c0_g1~~TRINITY_DN3957_c0_g1_i1.p1  ORF type:complete len:244 (-),score=96.68 TRINITY_DN3957_c0_g1_i1:153-884(-)